MYTIRWEVQTVCRENIIQREIDRCDIRPFKVFIRQVIKKEVETE